MIYVVFHLLLIRTNVKLLVESGCWSASSLVKVAVCSKHNGDRV